MKRKILFLALIVCSLISVFAISVFANETATEPKEPGLNIEAANLSFEDSVYVLYAVSHEGIPAESVKLLFWTEPEATVDAYVLGTEAYSKTYVDLDETVNGKSCVIFNNTELRAKNMADYVYARAYAVVDGVEYYSNVSKYSILQYAYNKLGYTGTESTNTALKNMLVSMLQYGADAQTYFEHNTSRLANETYYQIKVVGGLLEDGFTKGLYHAEEFATLTAPTAEPGFEFAGWKNSAGEIVSTANPLTLTDFSANETFTATYEKEELKYSEGLSYTLSSDKTYYSVKLGACTDTNIVIPPEYNGLPVEFIAERGFINNSSITSVTIPHSVKYIGELAFKNCGALTNIIFGENVVAIGKEAFSLCNSLTDITIPDSVTDIYPKAFYACANLSSVTIGTGVVGMGDYAFGNCTTLEKINFNAFNMSNLTSTSYVFYLANNDKGINVVIGKNVTKIPTYLFRAARVSNLEFEEGSVCDSIGEMAFYESLFTNISLPKTITNIGKNAFEKCSNLTSVIIPDSVKNIGEKAFLSCTNLDTVTLGSSVEYIGISAFASCTNLTNITFSNSIQTVDNYAFYNCTNLTSATMLNGVETIGSYAFKGCNKLVDVTIPSSVSSIGAGAFEGCSNLSGVYITDISAWCNTVYENAYSNPVYYARNLYLNGELINNLVIPSSVTNIAKYSFYHASNIKTVTMPNSVEQIGSAAFAGCANLKEVHISDIASWCNIIFESAEANPLYYAESLYVGGELVTDVVIPYGTVSVNMYAFYEFKGIVSIGIPGSVESIGKQAFYNCKNLASVTMDYGVISIGENAFDRCTNLVSFKMPNSVAEIGRYAFYYCSKLKDFSMSDSIVTIGDYAFSNCSNISGTINLENATSVGWCAFETCTSIESVIIGNGIEIIRSSAFAGCSSLESVTLPNSVSEIGECAFMECTSLANIIIPEGVTKIGSYAFQNCQSLNSINIPSSVSSIGTYAFSRCSYLESVYITDIASWCSIKFELFYSNPLGWGGADLYLNGKLVTDIVIPNGITTINDYAFYRLSSLRTVVIPDGVTSIGKEAFYSCSNLVNITIPDSVTTIGEKAFESCHNLVSITLGTSVASIGSSAFSSCNKLVEIYNRSGLTIEVGATGNGYVGYRAINVYTDTEGQKKTFVTEDGFIFYDDGDVCYLLGCSVDSAQLILPENYNGNNYEIYKYAFFINDIITMVVIPKSVTAIDGSAFNNCSNLKKVYYKGSVDDWNKIAIKGMSSELFKRVPKYFYSETEPTVSPEIAACWHYNENGEIVHW